jgi:hypothetical protein
MCGISFMTDFNLVCIVANVHEFLEKIQSSVLYGLKVYM